LGKFNKLKEMKRQNKDEKILHELYRRAFAASTPQGDFDLLLENATINEFGEKVIPFMDYECEEEVLESIFNSAMKEFKVPVYRRKAFSFNFYLGCSPKTKRKEIN
jgi:hypothetical protein